MVKAYIKSYMFHLPLPHNELKKQVQEQFYQNKELVQSSIGKMHPVQKIEDNDNILVEKQNTNIFLLNFLLLVLDKTDQSINDTKMYNDDYIINQLKELTNLNLSHNYNSIEEELINFLEFKDENNNHMEKQSGATKDTVEDVQFSMEWVKKTHSKLEGVK